MKLFPKNLFLSFWLSLGLVVGAVLRADEPAATVGETSVATPPEAVVTGVAVTPPVERVEPPLPETAAAPSGVAQEKPVQAPAPAPTREKGKARRAADTQLVVVGHNVTLAEGKKADQVVAIFGSATSAGEVRDQVVSILGNTRVTGGSVGHSAVAVLGNVYINGYVRDEVVAVLGNVELGPDAIVDGEIVCVGGQVIRHPQSTAGGAVQNIGGSVEHPDFSGVSAWFQQCLMKGRLLAFDRSVAWAWVVGLIFLGLYALIAWLAPGSVRRGVQTLEVNPGSSLLAAVLTLVLTPMAYLLLVVTIFIGIGLVLIPVFTFGLLALGLFGKLVVLAWLGRRLLGAPTEGVLAHPAIMTVVGGLVAMALYALPYAGVLIYHLLGLLGLGVVIYTLVQLMQERKAAAIKPSVAYAAGVGSEGAHAEPPPLTMLPPVLSAATLPRAGFWLRLGAALLDVIMVGLVSGLLAWLGGGFPLWLAIYSVVMWATKGTTIGGIICGLKVVRVDDRPVDWSVAAVRGLGAFLSLAVAGLGFIWVAFDDDRQSWHDKIAGTTIVRVPKGTALL